MNIYYKRYIDFLQKHNIYNEEILEYIRKHSTYIEYIDEEKREFIGCFYNIDKNNKLKKIHICIPYIDSDLTTLINIHEYIHILTLYPYLDKKYKSNNQEEILPIFYELLYFLDNPSNTLKEEIIKLNNKIKNSNQEKYKIALKCKKELLDYYQNKKTNFKALTQKAKILSKKYQSN